MPNSNSTKLILNVFLGTSALALLLGLGGCNTPTYGTGKSPEIAMIEELAGNLGASPKNKEEIDYSARADLVLPPNAALPSPEEAAKISENPAWPNDPDETKRAVQASTGEIPEEFRHGRLPKGATIASNTDTNQVDLLDMTPQQRLEAERKFREQLAELGPGDGTNRRYLTDPPTEYRQPSPDAPQPEEVVDSTKPRTLFGTLWKQMRGK